MATRTPIRSKKAGAKSSARAAKPAQKASPKSGTAARPGKASTLSVTDNRTGKSYEIPIEDGTVRAMDLRQIRTDKDDFGLMTYDPAFTNTASCRSAITYIDGDKGILEMLSSGFVRSRAPPWWSQSVW